MDRSIKAGISSTKQRYFDEPVFARPKNLSTIEAATAELCKRPLPRSFVVGYDRVQLRWMKPDGRGGLVPR